MNWRRNRNGVEKRAALYINTGLRLGTCLLLGLVMNKSRAMTQFALRFSIKERCREKRGAPRLFRGAPSSLLTKQKFGTSGAPCLKGKKGGVAQVFQ